MITILTWLWRQPNARFEYTTDHVNKWAEAIRQSTTVPHRIACVTDITEGLDSRIHVIAPPREFEHIKTKEWDERAGLPQCYRRVAMFAPDAAKRFGERFMCMDIDMLITGNIDHVLKREEDFLILRGTAATRPYNGGLIYMRAGCRPKVYTEFSQENAKKASKEFMGSDQAWISYCLGRSEKLLGEADGITTYSPRFIRVAGGHDNFQRPDDVCMLFFPGRIKAFNGVQEIWQPGKHDAPIINAMRTRQAVKKLYAYNDPKGWGKEMAKYGFKLIDKPDCVTPGDSVFVRLDQQAQQRETSLNFHDKCVSSRANTFPSALDAHLYDNKIGQIAHLAEWLPHTFYTTDREEAIEKALIMEYPFISKSSEGAGSANVRVIASQAGAMAEIARVFDGEGLPMSYYRSQRGYVYWQKIVPKNTCDYRVVITGQFVHGLVRNNRVGTIFASGSGSNYPMGFADKKEKLAAELAIKAADKIGTKWCAFDIVFDGDTPYILEVSAAWTVKSYVQCNLFTRSFERTTLNGGHVFAVAASLIKSEPIKYEIYKPYKLAKTCTLGQRGATVLLHSEDVLALKRNNVVIEIEGVDYERKTA